MDNYKLFDLGLLGAHKGEKFSTVLLLNNGQSSSINGLLGTPAIARAFNTGANINTAEGSMLYVKKVFPFRNIDDLQPLILPRENLMVVNDLSPLIEKHVIREVDNLKLKSTSIRNDVKMYVNEGLGITFISPLSPELINDFYDIVKYKSYYKFHTTTSIKGENFGNFSYSIDDYVVAVISFLPLAQCIPIFNHRKVDGFGLRITVTTKYALEDQSIFCLNNRRFALASIICSNYQDNIFVLDGKTINTQVLLSGEFKNDLYYYSGKEFITKYRNIAEKSMFDHQAMVEKEKSSREKAKTKEPKSGYVTLTYNDNWTTTASSYTWTTTSSTY